MTSLLNHSFEHSGLQVVLFTENKCHAAVIVLEKGKLGHIWREDVAHQSRALREFVGALFAHHSLWSFFESCHSILDIGLILE